MKSYENFTKNICDVSRETFNKLIALESFLLQKNKELNLISKNSEQDVWNRHVADSAQMYDLIPQSAKTLVDVGSGSGFPLHVFAIIAQEKTLYLNLVGVESIAKKTLYLKQACDYLGLSNTRVENARVETLSLKADVVTARAVASLDKLLGYALPICHSDTVGIFPKGEKHQAEIEEAKKLYNFDVELVDSKTSQLSKILIIKNIKEKK